MNSFEQKLLALGQEILGTKMDNSLEQEILAIKMGNNTPTGGDLKALKQELLVIDQSYSDKMGSYTHKCIATGCHVTAATESFCIEHHEQFNETKTRHIEAFCEATNPNRALYTLIWQLSLLTVRENPQELKDLDKRVQCGAFNKTGERCGKRCRNFTKSGTRLCYYHRESPGLMPGKKPKVCRVINKTGKRIGQPCKNKSRHESGHCHHHRN
jgi:hypothetical protein